MISCACVIGVSRCPACESFDELTMRKMGLRGPADDACVCGHTRASHGVNAFACNSFRRVAVPDAPIRARGSIGCVGDTGPIGFGFRPEPAVSFSMIMGPPDAQSFRLLRDSLELIRIGPDGAFYVRGNRAGSDAEIFGAFRDFFFEKRHPSLETAPVSKELSVPELKKHIFAQIRDLPRADREELVDVLSKEFGK